LGKTFWQNFYSFGKNIMPTTLFPFSFSLGFAKMGKSLAHPSFVKTTICQKGKKNHNLPSMAEITKYQLFNL
jgi:hypothetical protein